MGSLFSAPPPPPAPPPLPPVENLEDKERQRRQDALARKRRGRTGLITTSARGLLSKASDEASLKTRLGE